MSEGFSYGHISEEITTRIPPYLPFIGLQEVTVTHERNNGGRWGPSDFDPDNGYGLPDTSVSKAEWEADNADGDPILYVATETYTDPPFDAGLGNTGLIREEVINPVDDCAGNKGRYTDVSYTTIGNPSPGNPDPWWGVGRRTGGAVPNITSLCSHPFPDFPKDLTEYGVSVFPNRTIRAEIIRHSRYDVSGQHKRVRLVYGPAPFDYLKVWIRGELWKHSYEDGYDLVDDEYIVDEVELPFASKKNGFNFDISKSADPLDPIHYLASDSTWDLTPPPPSVGDNGDRYLAIVAVYKMSLIRGYVPPDPENDYGFPPPSFATRQWQWPLQLQLDSLK